MLVSIVGITTQIGLVVLDCIYKRKKKKTNIFLDPPDID